MIQEECIEVLDRIMRKVSFTAQPRAEYDPFHDILVILNESEEENRSFIGALGAVMFFVAQDPDIYIGMESKNSKILLYIQPGMYPMPGGYHRYSWDTVLDGLQIIEKRLE